MSGSNIQALLYSDGYLWIGYYEHGIDRVRLNNGDVKNYSVKPNNQMTSNNVYSLYKDRNGNLWAGALRGINRYDPIKDSFNKVNDSPNIYVRNIAQDDDGLLWFASYGNGLFTFNLRNNEWQKFNPLANVPGYDIVNVSALSTDKQNVFIAMSQGGLLHFDKKKDTLTKIDAELIENRQITSIVPFGGNYWMATNHGVLKYNVNNNVQYISSGIESNSISQYSTNLGLVTSDNKILFGGPNGITIIDPINVEINEVLPPVLLIDFYINYKRIDIQDDKAVISKNINFIDELVLASHQSSISFNFVSLSFVNPEHNKYAYMLKGFDSDWIETQQLHNANYTNLPAGKYVLKVKASNNDNVWNEDALNLAIVVKPHFLLSPLAILVYIIVFILSVFNLFRYIKKRNELRHNETIEEITQQKDKEVYDAKIEFFTNIVHEIRTPLSLIIGPLKSILKSNLQPSEIKEDLLMIEKNSDRLLNLVNQLLDFRKVEFNAFILRNEPTNLQSIINSVFVRFKPVADLKEIELNFECKVEDCYINTDIEAATKIFSNLLSNAVKYTTNKVSVFIEQHADNYNVKIEDNGEGIAPEDLDHIFKPFFQTRHLKHDSIGTGLGLALTKSLTDILGWKMSFSSKLNVGTEITLEIPKNSINKEAAKEVLGENERLAEVEYVEKEDILEPTVLDSGAKTILIIDDNPEILQFLSKQLRLEYDIFVAENADKALTIIGKENIDMIISDIMMPGIDGLELCNKLKSNIDSSHIPIILLTAKTNIDAKLKGLEYGADAYIEKPFTIDYLTAQISNIFSNQEKLRHSFTNLPFETHGKVVRNKPDNEFLNKLNNYILENISNSEINIDDLCNALGVGRTSLFLKIKALCGLSPIDYLRLIRLKKAAELLKSGSYRINDVAYVVGFNTPSYFSKCFQKQFGVLPNDFIAK